MHLAEILFDALAAQTVDWEPRLLQHGDRLGTNLCWIESGAVHLEAVAGALPQDRFRHLAASGVTGTKEEHAWKMHHLVPPSPRVDGLSTDSGARQPDATKS